MSKKLEKIEKPWGIYGRFIRLIGWGKIEKESADKTSLHIRYSEGQTFPLKLWDSNYVERFNTLEEMVKHYIKHRPNCDTRIDKQMTPDELRNKAKRDFPSYFKKKKK